MIKHKWKIRQFDYKRSASYKTEFVFVKIIYTCYGSFSCHMI